MGFLGQTVFDLGAPVYDALTAHALWRLHAERLLRGVALPAGPVRVLDLGCGPGMSALALAAALGPRARVLGLDLAGRMLTLARRKLARDPVGARLSLVRADALHLPLADASVDLVTGHSFLYLVPDPPGVLREAARVLRPGGALSLMEPRAGGTLSGLARSSLPAAGRALRESPASALRLGLAMTVWRVWSAGVGRFTPARAEGLLRQAGFEAIETEPTLGGLGLLVRGRRAASLEQARAERSEAGA